MALREKMRIAWFSPLNIGTDTSASVSAYASDELLPLLRENYDIELFHSGFEQYRDFSTFHYLSAFARHRERPYDFFFYQLEDRKSSHFIRVHLGLMPGVVWFHDFIFSSFGPEPILNSPWRQVVEKFNGHAQTWPARGEELDQIGPLGFREGAWALAPLFSNPVALTEYRRNIKIKLATNLESEHGSFIPLPAASRLIERKPGTEFRIGFCGSPEIQDRAHKLLHAVRELDCPFQLHWLIEERERLQAENLLKEFEITKYTFATGRTPQHWREIVTKCDAAVHTLFSVYGQPDPYLSISLMAKLPCVVTRFGSTEYLPENVVFKIEAGEMESAELREVLSTIHSRRIADVGAHGRAFALEMNASEHVARELSAVFNKHASRLGAFYEKWGAFEREAAHELITEAPTYMKDPLDWERLVRPTFEEFGWRK